MDSTSTAQLTYEELFGEDNYELINREKAEGLSTGCIWLNFSSELD